MKTISALILRLFGWTIDSHLPDHASRCVMIAAPHTSNWDFLYTLSAFRVMNIPIKFTIKKSWIESPIGWWIKRLGGLAIDRSSNADKGSRGSYIEQMAALIKKESRIAMVITPEGSRSRRTQWKTGFYHTAVTAQVPICLGYCDYKRKVIGVGKCFMPSGNIEMDMKLIMCFYKDVIGKNPNNFALDERYPCE